MKIGSISQRWTKLTIKYTTMVLWEKLTGHIDFLQLELRDEEVKRVMRTSADWTGREPERFRTSERTRDQWELRQRNKRAWLGWKDVPLNKGRVLDQKGWTTEQSGEMSRQPMIRKSTITESFHTVNSEYKVSKLTLLGYFWICGNNP